MQLTLTINHKPVKVTSSPGQTLLDLLRNTLGLTGTKRGCEIGECGACTVLLNGRAVNSCLVLAAQADGQEVLTVEGLSPDGRLTGLQEAFLDNDAVHCGFCTPGMLMSATSLLAESPRPSRNEIRTAIAGNLCRCTGYVQIIEAISDAADRSRHGDRK